MDKELIIDNFAGGGGASTGIELAVGCPVDIAINHDEDAIAMHKVNHPQTAHYQEDVFVINPETVTEGRPVGVAWFSPDCKHFSKAKGARPVEKKIRGLSWVILRWAMSKVSPRVIFMENVEEIKTWGPLMETNGKAHPDPLRAGETFNGFISMLTKGISKTHPAFQEACEFLRLEHDSDAADRLSKGLGYDVDFKILKACDYGAPTIRKRFYLIARRDRLPIVWPSPTHGEGNELIPYKTAAECLDWSTPCPSIFERKKALAVNTQRRIARGLDKFVLQNPRPFIMEMNYKNTAQDPEKPMTTQTTVNHHYLITPKIAQVNNSADNMQGQKVGEASTAVDTVLPYITKYFSGEKQAGSNIKEPMPTVTGIDHNALVAVHLMSRHGNGMDGRGKVLNAPSPTITADCHEHLIESHLCVLRNNMDCKDLCKPLSTITTSTGHFAQVTTYIQKHDVSQNTKNWDKVRRLMNDYTEYSIADDEILILEIKGIQYFVADIGMRMLKAKELKLAQGFPIDYIINLEPHIGKKYSEAKQIARLGNAVCPPVAETLVRANLVDMTRS